eukprot:3881171-Amphidinium_carterae.1
MVAPGDGVTMAVGVAGVAGAGVVLPLKTHCGTRSVDRRTMHSRHSRDSKNKEMAEVWCR